MPVWRSGSAAPLHGDGRRFESVNGYHFPVDLIKELYYNEEQSKLTYDLNNRRN